MHIPVGCSLDNFHETDIIKGTNHEYFVSVDRKEWSDDNGSTGRLAKRDEVIKWNQSGFRCRMRHDI